MLVFVSPKISILVSVRSVIKVVLHANIVTHLMSNHLFKDNGNDWTLIKPFDYLLQHCQRRNSSIRSCWHGTFCWTRTRRQSKLDQQFHSSYQRLDTRKR